MVHWRIQVHTIPITNALRTGENPAVLEEGGREAVSGGWLRGRAAVSGGSVKRGRQ